MLARMPTRGLFALRILVAGAAAFALFWWLRPSAREGERPVRAPVSAPAVAPPALPGLPAPAPSPSASAPPSGARPGSTEPSTATEPALFDERGRPTRAFLRQMLASTLADHDPGRKLSPDEIDRLADATLRMRDAQEELRALPPTPEYAERRSELRDEVLRANAAFTELLEVTPGELTEGAQPPGAGVERLGPGDEDPEPRDGALFGPEQPEDQRPE